MIDVTGIPRSSSQIKRGLELRRSELREDMDLLIRGRKSRPSDAQENGMAPLSGDSRLPLLSIAAAGAVVGFFLLRRSAWPLRLAGHVVELAAPVVVPVLFRRVLGRE